MIKTRKNKLANDVDKTKLWNSFESEIKQNTVPLECIVEENGPREICELCNSLLHTSEEGFPTCSNESCGVVYKNVLDQSPEWRYYGADDNQSSDPTRCGMPINPLLEESSYGCKVISSGRMSYEMRKIDRYTRWEAMPYKEQSLYREFERIRTLCQINGIPKIIVDQAIVYHKKISEYEQTFRGDNKDGILLAAIYIACRTNEYPRTVKELASAFNFDLTSATQACKIAQSIINDLEKEMNIKDKTSFSKVTSKSFIDRYCSHLNISNELTKLCLFICDKIEKKNLMPENTPHSIAAGVVYFVAQTCNINVSKRDVKNISEISEVTINKCYKKLEKFTTELIPAVILGKYNKQLLSTSCA